MTNAIADGPAQRLRPPGCCSSSTRSAATMARNESATPVRITAISGTSPAAEPCPHRASRARPRRAGDGKAGDGGDEAQLPDQHGSGDPDGDRREREQQAPADRLGDRHLHPGAQGSRRLPRRVAASALGYGAADDGKAIPGAWSAPLGPGAAAAPVVTGSSDGWVWSMVSPARKLSRPCGIGAATLRTAMPGVREMGGYPPFVPPTPPPASPSSAVRPPRPRERAGRRGPARGLHRPGRLHAGLHHAAARRPTSPTRGPLVAERHRRARRPAARHTPCGSSGSGGLGEAGTVVGTSSLGDVDLANERVHLGWTMYGSRWWGTQVNPECKLLLLGHAFELRLRAGQDPDRRGQPALPGGDRQARRHPRGRAAPAHATGRRHLPRHGGVQRPARRVAGRAGRPRASAGDAARSADAGSARAVARAAPTAAARA